ncbi:uncharacterized protein LOC129976547 [Argiope bruennichi]|uniref:Uncharacterized protein n=1 Tax=Argiope bruennichi TaxID=94029 RepID=A0A8T0EMG5_ARGBR|nr:uncharacterized protein LOC129976547 [Argiope bruennichi]KAF8777052.1 hypothetical protein HNY73_013977 [Argiope bruennichi]
MRHVLILLSCLLVSDALLQAASPMVMMYFRLNGAARLIRAVRFVRYLMRLRTVLRRLHLTRRFVGMVPLLLLGRNGRRHNFKFLTSQDTCLKRLACEVFTKPEPKGAQYDGITNAARQDNNGFKIFLTFDAPESDDYCKQRFASCPFSAMQIIKALIPIPGLQR